MIKVPIPIGELLDNISTSKEIKGVFYKLKL
jgi:hypothetical protein